ncbi:DUF2625 family protein [Candidatus Clostridium stratigraminis]|uniref:DUF2625 family protein n=1 Tax=Candidatus Clostridium stratigraminis TaxID=3381661 RepID=A0ABW8T725_9CLOT
MSKKLSELIYEEGNAWTMFETWFDKAENQVEVLPNTKADGEETLLQLQITNRSTMGAIALECGGLLVNHGWLRILGSGNERISGNLLSWNNISEIKIEYSIKNALIIAYDIVGGVYAINGGAFGQSFKNVFYFAPDTLEWEDTEKGYTDFINWALNGDINLYYKSFRWTGWEEDVRKLIGEYGISIFPYLWTKEGKNVNKCHREAIPMKEIWGIEQEFIKQMIKKD